MPSNITILNASEEQACHFERVFSNQAFLTFFNDIKQYAWRDFTNK